jgi:GxxExxY protein
MYEPLSEKEEQIATAVVDSSLMPVHDAQLLSYLKLTKKRLGFLINFNVLFIKQGVKRKIL